MNIWKGHNLDIEYDLLIPPQGFDYYSMTPKQAEEYFKWFVSKIPERTGYLANRCTLDLGISDGLFDFSPNSLLMVWRWFLKTARVEKKPKGNGIDIKRGREPIGELFGIREQFSVSTQYILRDIGMYLGKVFTANYPGITWDYYTIPKEDMFVNQPQLFGFVDQNYSPPFKPSFQPIYMAEVQAAKVFTKRQKEADLYDLFTTWEKNIPMTAN